MHMVSKINFGKTEGIVNSLSRNGFRKAGKFSHICKVINHMKDEIYSALLLKKIRRKSFALLIDPDKVDQTKLPALVELAVQARVDYLFVGGSLVVTNHLDQVVLQIKSLCKIPIILFPGTPSQVSAHADALLYLSLISGRNPELLIGQHVISAPAVRKSRLEIISTGYMVIDGGAPTTVSYISNALPIPADKNEIALCTAMAGEMLGMKMIYMDAGSGARRPITTEMIERVSENIEIPLLIGGGVQNPEKVYHNARAGADIIVVGNAIEKDATLLAEMASALHSVSLKPL
jgi:phosphoglycerol geranylgeranyltransferase